MTDPTHNDPFGRDVQVDSEPTVNNQADGMAVHGLLALLLPGEAKRVQQRVDRAIGAIRGSEKRLKQRAFSTTVRRRLAWVGGSIGIAAAIALAVLYVPSSSDSQAFAALESIRSSARQGGRTYSVRIELEPPVTSEGVPSDRPRPMKLVRTGELVMGTGGRWTFTISGMPGMKPPSQTKQRDEVASRSPLRSKCVFGFDGKVYWAVEPSGEIKTAASLRELRPPMIFGALDQSAGDSDAEPEPLTLESMLDKLDRGYEIKFEQAAAADTTSQRPVTVVSAQRLSDGRKKLAAFAPERVRIVADAQTFEVLTAEWEWSPVCEQFAPADRAKHAPDGQGPKTYGPPAIALQSKKHIFLALSEVNRSGAGSAKPVSDGWFEAKTHCEPAFSPEQR